MLYSKLKSKPATQGMAGLDDIQNLDQVSSSVLYCDKGSAFSGVMMSKFKSFTQTFAVTREAK